MGLRSLSDKKCDDHLVDGRSDPVCGSYCATLSRQDEPAYIYTWFPDSADLIKPQINQHDKLLVDPVGWFKSKYPRFWGLGPVRSMQLQHYPVEWLFELNGCSTYMDFFNRLLAYDFVARSCAMHGLVLGDDRIFSGEEYPVDPLPPGSMVTIPDDRVWPSGDLFKLDMEPYHPSDEGTNLLRSPLYQRIRGCMEKIRSRDLRLGRAEGHLQGALCHLPAVPYCEAAMSLLWPRAPESAPADFRRETRGDGTPFFMDPKSRIAGCTPSASSEWGDFPEGDLDYNEKAYWQFAKAVDNARYPLATIEGGDAFVVSDDRRVEVDVDRRPDFRRSVPGTFDCDYSRAAYAAAISPARPRWFRKIQGLPPRWRVLPPLREEDDPRFGFMMLWGRQTQFKGISDVPSFGRSQQEHARALHLESAIMRIIAMGVAGRIPLPSPEVIACVLGGSVYYDRLRASGWWWFLPPAGGKVAPLVVRITDLSDLTQSTTRNACMVDPGPERRVCVYDARRTPNVLEANPIRFSELKWFFYIGFVIAARICDLPYCFSVDAGTGGCRLKCFFDPKDGEKLVGMTYWLPELQNQPVDVLDPACPTSREGPQLARDVQAYLGFSMEKRYAKGFCKPISGDEIIDGPLCGRHRIDEGYDVAFYVMPDAPDNAQERADPPLVNDHERGNRDASDQPNLDALSALVENVKDWGAYSRISD